MSQSYKSSTDPQSVSGTSGVLTYTNLNALNVTHLKSTGSVDIDADIDIAGGISSTGSIALIGDFKLIDAVENVAGTTDLQITADLDNVSYQALTSTSGAIKKYLLATPSEGARKDILINAGGGGDVYVYASASSSYTAYFGANTSGNILAFTTPDSLLVSLIGLSTAKWGIANLSTLNNGTTGSLAIASSNS